jgi:RhtB (resistance to homoserine/threonine) family protein
MNGFDSQVLAFTVVAALLTLTPGADTMLVIRNVLRGGQRDGIITTVGICSGLFLHATLSALGLSMILMQSATAFHIVKWVGAAYLGWLGVHSLYSALPGIGRRLTAQSDGAWQPVPTHQSFAEGFLSNVLNPKVAIFYLAFLPQFIGPTDALLQKSILLAGIHFAEGILWLITVAIAIERARRVLLASAIRRWLDGICGVVLLGFGARLALERR